MRPKGLFAGMALLLLTLSGCDDDPGTPPVLDPPTVAAAPYADVLEGCLKLSFCAGDEYWDGCAADFTHTFSRLPDPAREAMNLYYQCAATAGDCTEVDQCLGTECDLENYIASCDANELMTCYYGTLVPIECSLPLTSGDTCHTMESGAGLCAERECTDGEDRTAWCRWDVHYNCPGHGYVTRTQCPLTAYDSCVEAWGPCTGTQDGSCVWGEYVGHCEGNVAMGCDGGTDMIWYHDCSKNPLRTQCIETAAGAGCVVPDGAPLCDTYDTTSCDGDVLQFCLGQARSFDCASIGMVCVQSMAGAYCNPEPL